MDLRPLSTVYHVEKYESQHLSPISTVYRENINPTNFKARCIVQNFLKQVPIKIWTQYFSLSFDKDSVFQYFSLSYLSTVYHGVSFVPNAYFG